VSAYIPTDLRSQIDQADRDRCCYCLTQTVNSDIPLSFDHIVPRSKGGTTTFENVCLACRSGNNAGITNELRDDRRCSETLGYPVVDIPVRQWVIVAADRGFTQYQ
jgi:5-methylcytosine-specific restriction endonuclease McrA